jgi:uncharacterized protein YutE (UPF0331/DUF86 family)
MSESTEADVLQALLPQLEEEGYTVYLHPNRPLIPSFLKGYAPDAIALRPDKNLAIEIALRQTDDNKERIQRIARMFQGQDKWELRVYWGGPTSPHAPLRVQTPEEIEARIAQLRVLGDKGHLEPALLLAWATFEALARATLSREFERPQTPGRIVEILAREGYVTPTEADQLRRLSDKRNKLVHGELQVRVSKEEIAAFEEVLNTLLAQVHQTSSTRHQSTA